MPKQDDHGDDLPRRVSGPQHHAAGAPAVVSAMRHALTQMGPARTLRTLTHVNQTDGFDCPGCAWPDPGGHRHIAEFCENGAKAVAEEATNRRADAGVFATHSVEQLAAHSDYFIGKLGRLTEPMHLAPGDTHYRPVSWDRAYEIIAAHIGALESPN